MNDLAVLALILGATFLAFGVLAFIDWTFDAFADSRDARRRNQARPWR